MAKDIPVPNIWATVMTSVKAVEFLSRICWCCGLSGAKDLGGEAGA